MKKNINNDAISASGAEVSIIPVMTGEGPAQLDLGTVPENVPVLALRNVVLFPGTIYPVTIGREKSVRLIQEVQKTNGYFIAAQSRTPRTCRYCRLSAHWQRLSAPSRCRTARFQP